MRDILPEIRAQGADLVIIGNGSRFFAQSFREELGLDVPILIDEDRRSYTSAGFRRGGSGMLSPRLFVNATRALLAGHRQTGIQGDALQLGGVLILSRENEVLYRFASRTAGDHPPTLDIVSALAGSRR